MARKQRTAPTKPHPIEWITGIGSGLVVAALIGSIAYQAMTDAGSSPDLIARRLPSVEGEPAGQVRFEVANRAGTTAAAVLVRGELRRADGTVETAETSIDYVPARSKAQGALLFEGNEGDVSIRAVGYADP